MTFSGCSSTEVSLLSPTICSLGITWIAGNSLWRQSVYSWPTRSNIQKISSSWEETTNARVSTESTAFMMNVSCVVIYSIFVSSVSQYWYRRALSVLETRSFFFWKVIQLAASSLTLFFLSVCLHDSGKRRYNIKLWKTFTDCFNCLPVAAIVDEKIFCCHGGLSPDLQSMEQIRRIMRPTDVPDQGLLCDLLWSDPDKVII